MPELTKEQKEGLKNWSKKRQIYSLIFTAWFIIMPLLYLIILCYIIEKSSLGFIDFVLYYYTERTFFGWVDIYSMNAYFPCGMLVIILFTLLIDIRYRKKCPNCNSKIGENYLIISLPEKCDKCGVKFK